VPAWPAIAHSPPPPVICRQISELECGDIAGAVATAASAPSAAAGLREAPAQTGSAAPQDDAMQSASQPAERSPSQDVDTVRRLRLRFASASIPHPDKVRACGREAGPVHQQHYRLEHRMIRRTQYPYALDFHQTEHAAAARFCGCQHLAARSLRVMRFTNIGDCHVHGEDIQICPVKTNCLGTQPCQLLNKSCNSAIHIC